MYNLLYKWLQNSSLMTFGTCCPVRDLPPPQWRHNGANTARLVCTRSPVGYEKERALGHLPPTPYTPKGAAFTCKSSAEIREFPSKDPIMWEIKGDDYTPCCPPSFTQRSFGCWDQCTTAPQPSWVCSHGSYAAKSQPVNDVRSLLFLSHVSHLAGFINLLPKLSNNFQQIFQFYILY